MSVALPNPRLLALVGLAVAALVAFVVARPMLMTGDTAPATSPSAQPSSPATAPTKASPTNPQPRVNRIRLLPGLPGPVARKLRQERVVVVSVYSAKAPSDRSALAQARTGAREVDAGFVALNVLNERNARRFASFVGVGETPTMLVVRRPGKVVNRIDGFVDSAIVAQAAQNAGAGKKRSSK
jgi:hypothetical protein